MATTEIPNEAIQIAGRFYEAIDYLVENRRFRGLGTLAKRWGVSRCSLSLAKNHPSDKRIKVEYLYYISRDFNVSLVWLFHGTGEMFDK